MRLIGKISSKCECCLEYRHNTYFFDWYSIFTEKHLARICYKCARRELFGSKYSYNKKFRIWIEKIKEK